MELCNMTYSLILILIFLLIVIIYLLYVFIPCKDDTNSEINYPCFVLVYKNGCPPCEGMKSDWNSAKEELSNKGVNVYEIDVYSENMKLFKNISGTPTIRWYKSQEEFIEYEGNRSRDSLVMFAADNI